MTAHRLINQNWPRTEISWRYCGVSAGNGDVAPKIAIRRRVGPWALDTFDPVLPYRLLFASVLRRSCQGAPASRSPRLGENASTSVRSFHAHSRHRRRRSLFLTRVGAALLSRAEAATSGQRVETGSCR